MHKLLSIIQRSNQGQHLATAQRYSADPLSEMSLLMSTSDTTKGIFHLKQREELIWQAPLSDNSLNIVG